MTTRRPDTAIARPGQSLATGHRTFSIVDLVLYAGATWDWHRLHYDSEYTDRMQLPGPVVDGQIYGALFARQAVDSFGPTAFVRKLEFRMRAMVFAGETVQIDGVVREVRRDPEADLVVLDQSLTRDGRPVADARTEVRVPR